ncbi:MAG: DUF362 domain-containing protein [Candidatus Aminicenantes bacterium]|nr:DUF362 domain-containing protein [Candidatus Aminicenantes bacterium]NIM79003.1 DUF362 domain-containing protein [Candidatus Aminicenantes bacterium]NIN18261.1 DUF362 domain-containing protein [Candidatus Aminicenantes bacterium]NIN42158.1 DUF362 domain-containing protein [Candidatus Aminicenantes bacterium]NIN84914.1 DUF362 domain-containing protein [Candidatus Aminicenantes bacterium]
MSNKKELKAITRRQFIRDTSVAAIGSTLFLGASPTVFSSGEKTATATVVLVRNKDVLDANGRPRYPVVLEMLDKAVTTLVGKKDPVEAWKTFIKPDDIVGIKTNVWGWIPTTSQVEKALKKRVMDVGVSEADIGISDRGVLRSSIFKKATALINARPMRSHHWSGVGSLIKNYIMFVPDPWSHHGDSCADLAKLWELPLVKGKTRLNVLVMLTPQFHSTGPHSFSPKYVWKYYGFLVGFDPVAIDATGLRIIQAKRKEFFGEDRPLNPPAKHILLADTRHHLGTADPNKIKLIKIGYDKDLML